MWPRLPRPRVRAAPTERGVAIPRLSSALRVRGRGGRAPPTGSSGRRTLPLTPWSRVAEGMRELPAAQPGPAHPRPHEMRAGAGVGGASSHEWVPVGVGRALTVREGLLALRGVGARGGGGWREGGGLRRGGRRALGAPRHGQQVPAGALGNPEGGLWWQGYAWGRVRCAHAPAGVRAGACAGGTGTCTYMASVQTRAWVTHKHVPRAGMHMHTSVTVGHMCPDTPDHRCAWSLYTPL